MAFGLGGLLSLTLGLFLIYKSLHIRLLGRIEYIYFVLSVIFGSLYYLNLAFAVKIFVTLVICIVYVYYFNKVGLINKLYEKIKTKKVSL